jgi:hypothetical protein
MKGGRTVWRFIKFFEKEEYADAFIAGSLYLNSLGYFKGLEGESDNGRADPTEALWAWLQPYDVDMTLSFPGHGQVRITEKDLAAPISFWDAEYDFVHVLCLHTVATDAGQSVIGEGLKIEVDRRCVGLGRFAVVVQPQPFLDRMRTVLSERGYRFRYDFVEYYDEKTFHGEIPRKNVPFTKQERFSYQREYRLCVYPGTPTNGPMTIGIGDLSDICTQMDVQHDLPP